MTNTPHRNWFITGATSGMGLSLTKAALQRGDNVVATGRNLAPLKEIADDFPQHLLPLSVDVCEQAQVDDAVTQGLNTFGHFDVVVHSAGYGLWGGVEEVSDADVRATFDTNVFGVLNVTRATLPSMRARRSGHVVIISGFRGQSASPGMGLISSVLYAKEGIGDTLVQEVAPLGIKVTMVEPGPTATKFRENAPRAGHIADYDQTVREALKIIESLPAEHSNLPEPVATAILAAVDADEPPLRLPTGSVAVNTVRESLHARLAELDKWESVCIAVDNDPSRSCPF